MLAQLKLAWKLAWKLALKLALKLAWKLAWKRLASKMINIQVESGHTCGPLALFSLFWIRTGLNQPVLFRHLVVETGTAEMYQESGVEIKSKNHFLSPVASCHLYRRCRAASIRGLPGP